MIKKTAVAIALASLGFSANAAVISFSAPLLLETTEINQTLNLNQFDSSLGTLESVSLQFFGQGVSSSSLRNTAANPQTFRFNSVLDLLFTDPLGLVNDMLSVSLFNTGFLSIAPNETRDLGTANVSDSLTLNRSSALDAFIGTGALSFQCESFVTNTQSGGGGNIEVIQNTQAGCGAMVTYTYSEATNPEPNPVPEPASLALLGLGLLGLGSLRRRKA